MKFKNIRKIALISITALLFAGCGKTPATSSACNHVYEDWDIEKVPTMSETGLATRYCLLCETKDEITLPVLSDSSYEKSQNTATCTEGGRQTFSYKVGSDSIDFRVETEPKGHEYVHHDATPLSLENTTGYEEYYSCANCNQLFNKDKKEISSLDEIATFAYEFDENGHWFKDKSTYEAHTFSEEVVETVASYFEKGISYKTCTVCSYKQIKEEPILSIGTINKDGVYNGNSIENFNPNGANKLADGLYAFGSAEKNIEFDSNKNILFGGQANKDSRILLFDIASPVKVIIKGGSPKANQQTTFGFYDGIPNEDADNFLGTPYTYDSTSTADFEFSLTNPGRYWFGCLDGCKIKIKTITIEMHEIDTTTWKCDETGHWHSGNSTDCVAKVDFANHTFGEWTAAEENKEKRTCEVCQYTEYRNAEEPEPVTTDYLNKDGVYNANSIEEPNTTGTNKLADGLYVLASEGGDVSFDSSNGNITLNGKASATDRVFKIITNGPAKFTIKASSTKAGTNVTFGIFDGTPNDNADNFVGATGSSDTTSTKDFNFAVNAAGTYYFGGNTKLKVKTFTVELHEVDSSKWQYDETKHWHGGNAEDCLIREDEAAHTFGEWISVDDTTDKKVCSVCNYSYTEAKELHKCDHNYVASVGSTEGKIKYECSKCHDSYEKGYSLYTPTTALDDQGADVNTFGVSVGSDYTIDENAAKCWYKGKLTTASLETAHEFTMANNEKMSFTNYLNTKLGGNVTANYLSVNVPGACTINVYLHCETEFNPRYTITGTDISNANIFETKPTAGFFGTASFDLTAAGELRLGTSSTTSVLSVFAIEIIY